MHFLVEITYDPASADALRTLVLEAGDKVSAIIAGKAADGFRMEGSWVALESSAAYLVLDAKDGGRTREPSGASRAAFSATTSIDRHDFGLEWSPLLETGGVLVGDRIDIELEVQAVET